MSHPEAFGDDARAEATTDPNSAIYFSCINEVEQGLATIQGQLDAGKEVPGAVSYGRVIEAMTERAAKNGDKATVEKYLTLIFQLPGVLEDSQARACFAGISNGSDFAYGRLQEALKTEAQKAEKILTVRRHTYPEVDPNEYPPSYLLRGTVEACEQYEILPHAWIDTHKTSEGHRWKLYVGHYGRMAKQGKPGAEERLQSTIRELLDSETFSDLFAFAEIPPALPMVTDPALRRELVRRFMASAEEVPLSPESLQHFVLAGKDVLLDAQVVEAAIVDDLRDIIEASADLLHEHGGNAVQIAQAKLPWDGEFERYKGAESEAIIQALDERVHQALNTGSSGEAEQYGLFAQRDGLLSTYATEAAQQQDFRKAQIFLDNVASEAGQIFTQRDCLSYATTLEQVRHLRPNEAAAIVYPGLQLQAQFTEAELKGDLDGLHHMALELAGIYVEGSQGILKNHHLKQAYVTTVMQDSRRGPDFARDILQALRATRTPYEITCYFSEALIRAGDSEEPERARQDIMRTSRHLGQRLTGMLRLATILRDTYPDTCV